MLLVYCTWLKLLREIICAEILEFVTYKDQVIYYYSSTTYPVSFFYPVFQVSGNPGIRHLKSHFTLLVSMKTFIYTLKLLDVCSDKGICLPTYSFLGAFDLFWTESSLRLWFVTFHNFFGPDFSRPINKQLLQGSASHGH